MSLKFDGISPSTAPSIAFPFTFIPCLASHVYEVRWLNLNFQSKVFLPLSNSAISHKTDESKKSRREDRKRVMQGLVFEERISNEA